MLWQLALGAIAKSLHLSAAALEAVLRVLSLHFSSFFIVRDHVYIGRARIPFEAVHLCTSELLRTRLS